MDEKMSKEQAERLADELLAQQPRQRDSKLVKTLQVLGRLSRCRTDPYEFNRNPWVDPAAPAWGVMHRDTDTSK